jgi:hypothetical protein
MVFLCFLRGFETDLQIAVESDRLSYYSNSCRFIPMGEGKVLPFSILQCLLLCNEEHDSFLGCAYGSVVNPTCKMISSTVPGEQVLLSVTFLCFLKQLAESKDTCYPVET